MSLFSPYTGKSHLDFNVIDLSLDCVAVIDPRYFEFPGYGEGVEGEAEEEYNKKWHYFVFFITSA